MAGLEALLLALWLAIIAFAGVMVIRGVRALERIAESLDQRGSPSRDQPTG